MLSTDAARKPDRRARGQGVCAAGAMSATSSKRTTGKNSGAAGGCCMMHSLFWPVSDISVRRADAGRLSDRRADGDRRRDHARRLSGLRRHDRLDHLADARPGPPDRANVQRAGLVWPRDRGHQARARAADRGRASAGRQRCAARSSFDDVCFEYDSRQRPCCKDISFRCEPGQAVALLGSTGSGKTTLVNLLPRFYDYTGGSLTLDGVELKDYPRHYLRQQIGIVEQEPFLFSRIDPREHHLRRRAGRVATPK